METVHNIILYKTVHFSPFWMQSISFRRWLHDIQGAAYLTSLIKASNCLAENKAIHVCGESCYLFPCGDIVFILKTKLLLMLVLNSKNHWMKFKVIW